MRRRALRSHRARYERKFSGGAGKGREVRLSLGWDYERVGRVDPGEDAQGDVSHWEEFEPFEQFLRPEEILIVRLAKIGKGSSDMAAILGLASRQHANKLFRFAIKVCRFFARHEVAVCRLVRGDLDLDRKDVVAMQMLILGRQLFGEVARHFGLAGRTSMSSRIYRRVRKRLREQQETAILKMLDESAIIRMAKGGARG